MEFPEIQQRDFKPGKAGFTPVFGWLAARYSYTRIQNEDARSVARWMGIEISSYTRAHAASLCDLELRITATEAELIQLLGDSQFSGYLRVFRKFGFGLRNQALLLSLVYPLDISNNELETLVTAWSKSNFWRCLFDKFLVDGRPWVEWEEDSNGKPQKRHRSLRSFQAYLGLSYTLKQSGDKSSKRFGGSDICRAHLYMWAVDTICVRRRLQTEIGQRLGDKYDSLRKWNLDDDGSRINPGDDAVAGRDAVMRVLFMATRLLFRELCRELIR